MSPRTRAGRSAAPGCGVLTGKRCYGHLGGTLGNRLFARLIELGWFRLGEGKTTVYEVTDLGRAELERLGVDITGE